MAPNDSDNTEFLQNLINVEDLPTLPAIAQQIIQMTMDPDADYKKFSKLIQSDPPIAAKVLKTANSAYYGKAHPAKTIEDAIFTIGLNHLAGICTSISIIQSFSHWEESNLELEMLWKHSISTAYLADRIAKREKIYGAVNFFLAGLFHDIGWMVLDHVAPELISVALMIVEEDGIWSRYLEQDLIGVDHAEVGAFVLDNWNIARELSELTRFHNDPEKAGGLASHACIIQFASALSPFPLPFTTPIGENLSPFNPIDLEASTGEGAHKEMQKRYAKDIKSTKDFTGLSLSMV
ncbi:MAG: HDOD domain-containing protein [Candidatus Electryonea clarkiae]|nr:HDOD domain-containing protein [Candidatus Electryonea clarkiae]MDP8286365.1 HDOD domain-containing protein [Candidatus Electryonea clarkiae]